MPERYVVCTSCQIGGYDFCPECLGAGGYTVNIDAIEEVLEKVDEDDLNRILRQLTLIEDKKGWNNKIELRLKEWYALLSESEYTEEVVDVLKRIMRYRVRQKEVQLERDFNNRLSNLTTIKIVMINSCILQFESPVFNFRRRKLPQVYLKQNRYVELDEKLFREFVLMLAKNALIGISGMKKSATRDSIENIIINVGMQRLFRLVFVDDDTNYIFVTSMDRVSEVLIKYLNHLQSRNVIGWRYVDGN